MCGRDKNKGENIIDSSQYMVRTENHPQAKILMSSDAGAALERPDAPVYVDDFDARTEHMRYFQQRWMPSNRAKKAWIERVKKLDPTLF
jgi:flavorubredoxin